jgi:calcineurin-like phosphoesterase family protein
MTEKIWFTSDNHFSHKNIKNFCPNSRYGSDFQDMDEKMIAAWNERVSDVDRVYTLGDVFFCNAERARSIMRRLKGHIHLIWGNHDGVIESNSDLRNMFDSTQNYKEIVVENVHVVLFHYPVYEWNRMQRGAYHLFGHVHGNQKIEGRALDVGIDGELNTCQMAPYSWEEIHRHLSKKEIRSHHPKVIL